MKIFGGKRAARAARTVLLSVERVISRNAMRGAKHGKLLLLWRYESGNSPCALSCALFPARKRLEKIQSCTVLASAQRGSRKTRPPRRRPSLRAVGRDDPRFGADIFRVCVGCHRLSLSGSATGCVNSALTLSSSWRVRSNRLLVSERRSRPVRLLGWALATPIYTKHLVGASGT